MADRLEELVKQTEGDINQSQLKQKKRTERPEVKLPRVSVALGIWLTAIFVMIYGFEDAISIVLSPSENHIERDLTAVLTSAATSLRNYQHESGMLPAVLPNPSIRGLVHYERQNDFHFVLSASVGDVTMVLESDKANAHRKEYP